MLYMNKIVNSNQHASWTRSSINRNIRNTGSIRDFRSVNSHCSIFLMFRCRDDWGRNRLYPTSSSVKYWARLIHEFICLSRRSRAHIYDVLYQI